MQLSKSSEILLKCHFFFVLSFHSRFEFLVGHSCQSVYIVDHLLISKLLTSFILVRQIKVTVHISKVSYWKIYLTRQPSPCNESGYSVCRHSNEEPTRTRTIRGRFGHCIMPFRNVFWSLHGCVTSRTPHWPTLFFYFQAKIDAQLPMKNLNRL